MHRLKFAMALTSSLVGLGMLGCASVRSERTGEVFSPSRPADCAIEVHASAPAAAFDRVCEIEAPTPYETAIGAIKASACACGADAIVVPSAQTSPLPGPLTKKEIDDELKRNRVIGIKYRSRKAE